MLDGRLITCAERLQVQHFFQDSALSSRPVVCIYAKFSIFGRFLSCHKCYIFIDGKDPSSKKPFCFDFLNYLPSLKCRFLI